MHLKDIKPRVFGQMLRQMDQRLQEDEAMALLEEAMEDTPLISRLVWEMRLRMETLEEPQRQLVALANRDLLVLMTLRELEKNPEGLAPSPHKSLRSAPGSPQDN